MRIEIHPGSLTWTPTARTHLARTERRLAVRVERYRLAPAALEAGFDQLDDGAVVAHMALETRAGKVEVRSREADLDTALDTVIERLFAALDRQHLEAGGTITEAPDTGELGGWLREGPAFHQELLREGLASLERAAAWELARLQIEGELAPGQLLAEDVVSTVLAEELDHVDPQVGLESTVASLQHRVAARVRELAAALAEAPVTTTSIDELVPAATPARAVSLLDSDLQALTVGGEVLHLEDVLADGSTDPAELVAEAEFRRNLVQALFVLAPAQRRLVEQRIIDGFSAETVASHEQLRAEEVEPALLEALEALGEMLGEERALPPAEVRSVYRALGELLREERAARTAELVRTEYDDSGRPRS